jgi:hypothetical protein
MNRKRFWMFPLIGLGFLALGSGLVMLLWNHIMPEIIPGVKEVNYWQAAGLLVLCRLLFGSFGGRGGWKKGDHGRGTSHWKNKWSNMTPEEKEKMKEEWKKRCAS